MNKAIHYKPQPHQTKAKQATRQAKPQQAKPKPHAKPSQSQTKAKPKPQQAKPSIKLIKNKIEILFNIIV